MLTIRDLDDITAYILAQRGPMLPVDIRQVLDKIAQESGFFNVTGITEKEIWEFVIDPMYYPPMQAITRQLEEWDRKNHSDGRIVVHLFYAGSPQRNKNRHRRKLWEMSHPGKEEVIEHEFTGGEPNRLTVEQKEEFEWILNLPDQRG